jgi:hypothetical protein
MDKTITLRYKDLPDSAGAPGPVKKRDIVKDQAARIRREKARLLADKVIDKYRKKLDPPVPRPQETGDLNNNLLRE